MVARRSLRPVRLPVPPFARCSERLRRRAITLHVGSAMTDSNKSQLPNSISNCVAGSPARIRTSAIRFKVGCSAAKLPGSCPGQRLKTPQHGRRIKCQHCAASFQAGAPGET